MLSTHSVCRMAAMRIWRLKLFSSSVKSATGFDIRPSVAYTSKCYHSRETRNSQKLDQNGFRMLGLSCAASAQYSKGSRFDASFSNRILRNSSFSNSLSFAGINPLINHRLFSSSSEAKGSPPSDVVANYGTSGVSGGNGGVGGGDWTDKFKEIWQYTVEAAKYTGEKAKETSNEVAPHVEQWIDTHPSLSILAGTFFAWFLLPMLFRQFHKYSVQGPGALLRGSSLLGPVPYENSFWGALEDPIRYFITFAAFLQIGGMVAPTVIASESVAQAWKVAYVVSIIWFLHRWKTNVIDRALATERIEGGQRTKVLTLDKISSVGLFGIGLMSLAEACGVPVQSLLTVGGIGGVATAFAARDILGNALSGLSPQPFSIGDTIKAGSVEGEVIEMRLTTTTLLNAEKFPVVVPNSLFSSQVIINKSRARLRSIERKIPLQIDDIDKIPQISEDIKVMLRSNSSVFLEKEAPYCFLSRIERSYAELTLGCNLKQMNKNTEQDILLEAVKIIKGHGAMLGSMKEYTLN